MTGFDQITDLSDLDGIRAVIAAQPHGAAVQPLGIRELIISPTATDRIVPVLKALTADASVLRPRIVLIVDTTRILRAGSDLKASVAAELRRDFELVTLELGGDHLSADDAALDEATAAVAGADGVVTIGGGTISDIGKVATHRGGGIPLVVVQTAASVDGFTDNVSVILRNGVKRTIDSRWPDAVIADTTTIAGAPLEMNSAGFVELLSLYTAPADWELAAIAGLDNTFNEIPRDLMLSFVGDATEWSRGLASGEIESVGQLTRMLALRGIGTGIAGTTAVLSGVEHIVSHMLDMHADARHTPIGLHGAQVGVAAVVGAAVWDEFARRMADGTAELHLPTDDEAESTVRAAFASIDPTGARGAECWSDYRKKLERMRANAGVIQAALDDWATWGAQLAASVPSPEYLAQALISAGSPARPSELGTSVTAAEWEWAVTN